MKTRLTYIGGIMRKNDMRFADYQCECGVVKSIRMSSVDQGIIKSCGCLRREVITERNTIHGLRHTREYSIWAKIKQRIFDKDNKDYHNYGGRGIQLHSDWIQNPEAFIFYIKTLPDSGDSTLSLDRVDNDGHYEPGNLKWSTIKEQAQNRRLNLKRVKNPRHTLHISRLAFDSQDAS